MSLLWIDEYVDGVMDYCYSNDIFEIYSTLNINIQRLDKNDLLLQGNEALYIRNYFDVEIVFVRDDLSYKYEKFVLSHELGHAILHTEIAQASFSSKLINKGKLERQADYFACKLLNIKIDDAYHYEFSTKQIARDLGVSNEALEHLEVSKCE